ncbi:hypothetical protein [Dactylosporangium maewongense]|uniref:hypothetical protein n=1 Tax=Dactylosporangium maewongense TaxID=634393 RepID=UPI0031D6427C
MSGGAVIVGGKAQVGLDDLRITADLKAVSVTAVEDEDGFGGGWRVVARAVCTATLSGLELVTATVPASSSTMKALGVRCPEGKHLQGMGAAITGGGGQARLTTIMAATDQGPAMLVTATEDGNGYGGSWTLAGQAVCAK